MRFTVLTPTYNRAHTLHRVYESLCEQTYRDFEWLIIDDGSTDQTGEIVSGWKSWFPIRYVQKSNGGKHSAVNLGASLAQGEFVLILDSDDACLPRAMERFDYHWRQVPDPARFLGTSGLCCTPDGKLSGIPYSDHPIDGSSLADALRYGGNCERWTMIRTDVLREFPFPEGERFVTEALIWNRMLKKYAVRYFNEPVRVYYPDSGGLSANGKQLLISSPKATLAYFRELALSSVPFQVRLKAAANFCRFACLSWFSRIFRLN